MSAGVGMPTTDECGGGNAHHGQLAPAGAFIVKAPSRVEVTKRDLAAGLETTLA
jgi:hypothetical protein